MSDDKSLHKRHQHWINNAQDWRGKSREQQEKWLFTKLNDYHNPKDWLLNGAKDEDAQNIGALILRIPSRRLCRRLARILIEG